MPRSFTTFAALLALVLPAPAAGQYLDVWGGDVLLEVEPRANKSQTRERDQSAQLAWSGPNEPAKITAETFCPGQRYELEVRAKGVKNGKANGWITLADGAWPMDIIRDVRADRSGKAKLEYRTTIYASDTAGADYHSVRYVMTAQ